MKRIILSLLLFLLALSPLLAQSTFSNRISFGLEAGPQFNSVRNGGFSNAKGRISGNVGAYAQYDISGRFNLNFGIYYDPRGFETSFQTAFLMLSDTGYVGYNSFYAYDMTYKINYLTFPLNFVYLSGGTKFRLFVEGGVYLSIALYSHEKGYRGIYIDPVDLPHYGDSTLTAGYHMVDYDGTARDFFNATDFGLHFAFGLIYQFTDKIAFSFKPGFSFGLTPIVSNPDIDLKWDRILRINVGVVYKLHPYVKQKKEYILQ
jgi:hypothetical protein